MITKPIIYDPTKTNFLEYSNVEEIIVPSTIKKIDKRTFANFNNLKKVIIEEGVELIDDEAFLNCSSLQEIILPNSLKKLNNGVFKNCTNLTTINIPDTITTLKDELFKGCKKLNIKLDNITELGNSVFEDCHKLTYYPTKVKQLGTSTFKNCYNLNNVNLSYELNNLPDKAFEGCKSLINISSTNKISIGKSCFKNCYSLKNIPSFINSYNEYAFENCAGLEEITINFSHIPTACFRGCTNIKRIYNTKQLYKLDNFAFSGCTNLTEIDLSSIYIIPSEVLSNCTNLTTVTLGSFTKKINSRAFYKCINLTNIELADTIEHIGNEAFRYCHSIPSITLPADLKKINAATFGSMDSLENIYISPYNKNFITTDNKLIFDKTNQNILLYASGNKDKTYSLIPQTVVKNDNFEYINPISRISSYAFVGVKKLEELVIGTSVTCLENNAFEENPKLKTLTIEGVDLHTTHSFDLFSKISNKGPLGLSNLIEENYKYPFETINYKGRIDLINSHALVEFPNVKVINILTEGPTKICQDTFSAQKLMKKLYLPENIIEISPLAFPKETIVWFDYTNKNIIDLENNIFTNILIEEEVSKNKVKAIKDFSYLTTKFKSKYYTENYKEYHTPTEYIVTNTTKVYTINKNTINELCSNAHLIVDKPALFIEYTNQLKENNLYIPQLLNGLLINTLSVENRLLLFKEINEHPYLLSELEKLLHVKELDKETNKSKIKVLTNIDQFITKVKLLHELNITDDIFRQPEILTLFSNEDYEQLLKNNRLLFNKLLQNITSNKIEKNMNSINIENLLNTNIKEETQEDGHKIYNYIEVLKIENKTSPTLLNKTIALNYNHLSEKLIKNYDKHLQRALLNSECLTNNQNFLDLLKLLEVTGCLEENSLTRQKACTFITEKIFASTVNSKKRNDYQIISDNVHRFFNFNGKEVKYNKDFAEFFMINYKELIKNEVSKGYVNISRIYENFDELKKVSIANNGSRRQLKVTLNRCISYFTLSKFTTVSEEDLFIAKTINKWCDTEEEINNCISLYKESVHAPRNIFTKIEYNKDKKPIYDNSSIHDLKEALRLDYSYEWLPKQDPENIVLGNYCNCCAHFKGAGRGITKASMTLNNCQNLIIRDELGIIIGKATLAINKEEKYGVYNTFESSFDKSKKEEKENMYQALIRGTNIFIKTYNENNPSNQLEKITIGTGSNTISQTLVNHNHPFHKPLTSLNYSEYNNMNSNYNGNWQGQQILVKKL